LDEHKSPEKPTQKLTHWSSRRQVCSLFPSSRQLPSRVRLFIDAMADWLNRRYRRISRCSGVTARDAVVHLPWKSSTAGC